VGEAPSRRQLAAVGRFPANLGLGQTPVVRLPRREIDWALFPDPVEDGTSSASVWTSVDILSRPDDLDRSIADAQLIELGARHDRWRRDLEFRRFPDAGGVEFVPHGVEYRQIFPRGEGRLC